MSVSFRRPLRARRSFVACALLALTGCQSHKIVARINNEAVTDQVYQDRAERVNSIDPQQGLDAGGVALYTIIHEKLIDQLAQQKGYAVSEDALNKVVDFVIRNPQYQNTLAQGLSTREDIKRQIKSALETSAIGTDGGKADDKEIQAAFTERKATFTLPETWVIRSLPVPTEAQGQVVLNSLKVTRDFRTEAAKLGYAGRALANAGAPNYIPVDRLQTVPALYSALKTLQPGQFVASPVALPPNPEQQQQGAGPSYACIQLVEKRAAYVPTVDEIRPLLSEVALAKKFPQLAQHANQSLSEFTLKSAPTIEINIERYKDLLPSFIVPTARNYRPTSAGGSLAPSSDQGAPPSAMPPPSVSPGAGGQSAPGAPPGKPGP